MRTKRGYDRDTPKNLQRDYRLFAIACEGGKREPEYFNLFRFISKRVAVDIIDEVVSDVDMEQTHQHKSAPKWVLNRAMMYIEKEGLSEEDELWFVLDKDRWSDEQLREIFEYCQQHANWNIVISNPCFEVWLYLHRKKDIDAIPQESCAEFKHILHDFEKGGYHPLKFVGDLLTATSNAKAMDEDHNYFIPAQKRTKLYMLVDSIMNFVGNNEFKYFLDLTLPLLIKEHQKRLALKSRK